MVSEIKDKKIHGKLLREILKKDKGARKIHSTATR